jgi:phage antirepressor YoqD-like protein
MMTVREAAEVLGVAHDKITRKVRELFPDLVQKGITTYLNEAQVTAVKMAITSQLAAMIPTQNCVGRENEPAAKVVSAKTRLEKALLIQQAMRFQDEIIAEMEAENAALRAKSENGRPKVEFFDRAADSRDAVSLRDAASVLNMPGWGRNKIFALLRESGIIDGRNIPYREYQDRGLFRVIEQTWTDKEGKPISP